MKLSAHWLIYMYGLSLALQSHTFWCHHIGFAEVTHHVAELLTRYTQHAQYYVLQVGLHTLTM